MLAVSGKEDKAIYSGKIDDRIYRPEGSAVQSVDKKVVEVKATNLEEKIKFGKRVYDANCMACHQPNGQGIPSAFPPVAKSDYLNEDPLRGVHAIVHGLEGPIKVNGESFNSVMPAMQLSDDEIANVMTYLLNSWDNNGGEITVEQVKKVRAQKPH